MSFRNCQLLSKYCPLFPLFLLLNSAAPIAGLKFYVFHFWDKLITQNDLRYLLVDKLSTIFSPFTQDIDIFFTRQPPVDNFHAQIVVVVDKPRKPIAYQAII